MTETETETRQAAAISVPAWKLRRMLEAVIPHAGDDDTLPALMAVRFEVRGGVLYTAATNRYAIGVARCPVPGAQASPPPDDEWQLQIDDARALSGQLAKARDIAALSLTDEGERLAVDLGEETASFTVSGEGKWPDWRSLLRGPLAADEIPLGDEFGLDPHYLRPFTQTFGGKLDGEAEPLLVHMRRHTADGKWPLVLLTRGDWFLGGLMPVRLTPATMTPEAAAGNWADWAAVTAETAEVPA